MPACRGLGDAEAGTTRLEPPSRAPWRSTSHTYSATAVPTAALVISIVTLAGIGALLGAFTGWAVITGDEPEARVWPELEERLAA